MEDRVRAPAIAMIVLGAAGALLHAVGALASLIGAVLTPELDRYVVRPPIDWVREVRLANPIAPFVWCAAGVAISSLVVFAGVRMYELRSWALAVAGAVLLFVPCGGPMCCTCGFSIPFGVWALVVLLNEDVKRTFKS
jgi:hypothetical protein